MIKRIAVKISISGKLCTQLWSIRVLSLFASFSLVISSEGFLFLRVICEEKEMRKELTGVCEAAVDNQWHFPKLHF